MLLDPRLRGEDLPPRVDVALLAGRLGRQVLLARRRLFDVRHAGRVGVHALSDGDEAEHRVVVRVDERADRQPRPVVVLAVQSLQQFDRLVGGERVLHRPGVVLAQAVRLGPDPLREAEPIEQVGLHVLLDVLRLGRPVVVDRQQVALAVLGVQVRVRGVPLALEVGPVAAGAKPVAHRRHRVRRQPELLVRVVGRLRDAVGLGDPVQRWIVAREQRRPARRARRRQRIDLHYGHLAVDSHQHAVTPGRARSRTGRRRRVDVGPEARNAAQRHGFQASQQRLPAGGGGSVDVEGEAGRARDKQKGLISSDFVKPSDGLEPSTPSLPSGVAGR